MSIPTPTIEHFTRRLADCPSEFLTLPENEAAAEEFVDAVLYDLMKALAPSITLADVRSALILPGDPAQRANSRRLYLILAWLLHDPFFRALGVPVDALRSLPLHRCEPLSRILSASQFVTDPDRREELCRAVLHHLDLLPGGESQEFAADRLMSLDSLERRRLLKETKEKARRAEELKKKMAEEAAREAASHYGREY